MTMNTECIAHRPDSSPFMQVRHVLSTSCVYSSLPTRHNIELGRQEYVCLIDHPYISVSQNEELLLASLALHHKLIITNNTP